LSNGAPIDAFEAEEIISHPEVVDCGGALFADMPADHAARS
jgi:hypothetical protein